MAKRFDVEAMRREREREARSRYLARPDTGLCCVCQRPRDPTSLLLCRACIDDSIERARVIDLQSIALGDQRRAREAQWSAPVEAPA